MIAHYVPGVGNRWETVSEAARHSPLRSRRGEVACEVLVALLEALHEAGVLSSARVLGVLGLFPPQSEGCP